VHDVLALATADELGLVNHGSYLAGKRRGVEVKRMFPATWLKYLHEDALADQAALPTVRTFFAGQSRSDRAEHLKVLASELEGTPLLARLNVFHARKSIAELHPPQTRDLFDAEVL
jgi:hypothetical protein